MPLVILQTVRSVTVCKFCQQLALECTKLIKLGTMRLVPSAFAMLLVFGSSNAGSLKKDIQ